MYANEDMISIIGLSMIWLATFAANQPHGQRINLNKSAIDFNTSEYIGYAN